MASFPPHPEPVLHAASVRHWALEAGFDDAGLVALPHANEARDAARFQDWVRAGRAATMRYMTRTAPTTNGETGHLIRARTSIPFPWARSAIVCFASYNSAHPRSTEPAPPETAWIARYAWTSRVDASRTRRPTDYHKVLLKQLRTLEARIREHYGKFESRAYVDTGPVMERALSTAAGLGWTAKNTCLIHPKLGSYGFLAVLLTSMPVQHENRVPQVPRFWGPGIAEPSTSPDSSTTKAGCPRSRFWDLG